GTHIVGLISVVDGRRIPANRVTVTVLPLPSNVSLIANPTAPEINQSVDFHASLRRMLRQSISSTGVTAHRAAIGAPPRIRVTCTNLPERMPHSLWRGYARHQFRAPLFRLQYTICLLCS